MQLRWRVLGPGGASLFCRTDYTRNQGKRQRVNFLEQIGVVLQSRRDGTMTVCIAALCDNGAGCVLVSDQMTTAHIPIGYEFENEEVKKIVPLANSICVLVAGDILFAHEVIEKTKGRIAQDGLTAIGPVAELVRQQYQDTRKAVIVRNELESRGLDLNSYYAGQQRMLAQIVQIIDGQFRLFNPGVDLIVTGRGEAGFSVYTIANPGLATCNDPIGFAAIGSGSPHAMYALIEAGYKKSLPKIDVEKMVQSAKKRSQVAPGVGTKTEQVSL